MKAGDLKHYATLQNKNTTVTVDGHGTVVPVGSAWIDTATGIPTKIETLSGREAELARQIVASADSRITLRYIAGVTPESRFVWNNRIFNVQWINNTNQQNFELICLTQEVIQ